ncbi:bifunctional UDP-sugar hydrolase/5'-nucleotidase UshA [Aquabacterium sp. OR-4]|uniref:bifunctional UDP-sugar hydrolase/5'-nucleotidase UshA n=1 Tax=Aquabacterium sp. OR-4 TaxID=2978127 RepID=UPI0021B1BC85|nr:bifunctional UDP-sugar hydrolase/5'-nucleotidase UshA [Aquabacterium sp. OR-4]MDT7833960.1 bifunctional UDP-sugar hydrolase/5'-nucleotidase UshA [Aquabacterium sp. OR-4]
MAMTQRSPIAVPTRRSHASSLGLAALAAALLAGCASTPQPTAPAAPRAPLKLTILHTNDHHGRFWPNADGEYGLAARKTLIDRVRAEVAAAGGELLLLDGGDINTGVPESDLQDAEPDFQGMNRLGYDAVAVGNHEFDKPRSVLQRQRQWANFPLLSANVYQDGQRLFEPYRIFERRGYKIAVMGLTTDDTAKMVLPDNVRGTEFRKPIDEAARLVPALRAQADMVIAATHMGHYSDGKRGVNAPGDVEMARAVTGLDLIVGGHSQDPVCMLAENRRNTAYVPGQPCAPDRQNGTWIVQAHEWGKYVGRADFVIDAGRVEMLKYQLLPVNLSRKLADGTRAPYAERIPEDEGLRAFLQPFQERGQARLGVPVAQADGVLDGDRNTVRKQPTTLGTLIARAMMDKVGADVGLINGGGVRDSLPAGTITYRDVLKVQPFSNTVGVVVLSGAELLDYLRTAARMTPGSGAFAQTAGVRLRIEGGVLTDAQVGGQPIDPQRRYRLAINNFTATGGDGYPKLRDHPGYTDSGFNDAEVLRAYLAARSPLKVADFEPGDAVVRR